MTGDDCPMCTKWLDEPDLRVVELDRTCVLLNRDQFFTGYCFVVAKDHVTELFHLDPAERAAVMEEVTAVAAAVAAVFRPDKVNYELLGNMVPHMHWHVVPRFRSDPLWPRPIWAEPHEEVLLSAAEYAERIQIIRSVLRPDM
jgi:diadenosine tetraphosphate (Ap4A) HIT family hydrolase